MVDERSEARAKRDWARADVIRDQLKEQGIASNNLRQIQLRQQNKLVGLNRQSSLKLKYNLNKLM